MIPRSDDTSEVRTMEPRTRTSTVNLTLTIQTAGGVPHDLTAQALADAAAVAVRIALADDGAGAPVVTGKVSSAFIVRTEVPA